jgi:hypothetical protein
MKRLDGVTTKGGDLMKTCIQGSSIVLVSKEIELLTDYRARRGKFLPHCQLSEVDGLIWPSRHRVQTRVAGL